MWGFLYERDTEIRKILYGGGRLQIKLAFLDEEQEYLRQLSAFLAVKKEPFFKVCTFEDAGVFLECQKQEPFDAVVATASMFHRILQEDLCKILLSEGECPSYAEGFPLVKKYQKAEKMFAQVAAFLRQEKSGCGEPPPGGNAGLIGVCSPSGSRQQMFFSLLLAGVLAEEKQVLYVNLLANSGFYRIFEQEISGDIADLVYGMSAEQQDFGLELLQLRQKLNGFDYLPPSVNPEHIAEMTGEQYQKLIALLRLYSGYDVIVLDLGMIFPGFAGQAAGFDRLFCVSGESYADHCRMDDFLEYLDRAEESGIPKPVCVKLPQETDCENSIQMEQCLYGSSGDYVRSCLDGGVVYG